jgi:predicted metal-dependent hydrolase
MRSKQQQKKSPRTVAGAKAKARAKRKAAYPKLPMQRELPFAHVGRYFDLKAIFDRLNAKYFQNRLRRYTITWGRKRKERPREYFIFGSIQEQDRIIRIHPLLDARFVPRWFLDYVIYHEMLHSVVPDKYDRKRRRRIVHTEEFNEREKEFPLYRRAKNWEEQNLARFLQ